MHSKTPPTSPATDDEREIVANMLAHHRRAGKVATDHLIHALTDAVADGADRDELRRIAAIALTGLPLVH